MDIGARKQSFKRTIDADASAASRRKLTEKNRAKLKQDFLTQRRQAIVMQVAAATPTTPAAAQFTEWIRLVQSGNLSDDKLRELQDQIVQLTTQRLSFSMEDIRLLMQVLLLVCSDMPGKQLLLFFPLIVPMLQCGDVELVRSAGLFLMNALQNDTDLDEVNTFVWEYDEDCVGVIIGIFPSQNIDVQVILAGVLKIACNVRNLARVSRLLPFILGMLRGSRETCTMGLEIASEISNDATLEELHLIRNFGLIKECLELIYAAREENAACIERALSVLEAFSHFGNETDAPSFWILSDGVLPACEKLARSEWFLEDMYAELLSLIVSNLAISCVEAVVKHGALCVSLAEFACNEFLCDKTREEALQFFLNLSKLPDLSAERCQQFVDFRGFHVLINALQTYASAKTTLQSEIVMCIRDILGASPVHAIDFADASGVAVMLHQLVRSEGYLQTLCFNILSTHFPSVFETGSMQ